MADKKIEVKLTCELVAEGQYYLKGIRLHFDEPWAVYVVNGDCYIPYYRIYINGNFVGVAQYECQVYDFLFKTEYALATRL